MGQDVIGTLVAFTGVSSRNSMDTGIYAVIMTDDGRYHSDSLKNIVNIEFDEASKKKDQIELKEEFYD